jgi:hypothetical protein
MRTISIWFFITCFSSASLLAVRADEDTCVDLSKIDAAVERAVTFLKQSRTNGIWTAKTGTMEDDVALTSLAACSLLETGVPRDEPVLKKAARFVRRNVDKITARGGSTNAVAWAVIFLDHYCENPRKLIRRAVVRLAAGQDLASGAWGCEAPQLSDDEYRSWLKLLKSKRHQMPPEMRIFANTGNANAKWDNSSTLMATMAMWIGRRYGVPTDLPLRLAERHFRDTQRVDGSWSYGPTVIGHNKSSPVMTCAGLFGLAFGFATRDSRKAMDQDAAIEAAVKNLGTVIGRDYKKCSIPQLNYFLWSLERVRVFYSWDQSIDGKDSYYWSAITLLRTQQGNGSWNNDPAIGPIADTAFAILALKRAVLID